MSVRKQSPYGPFVERVILPSARIGALFLAVLAIGLGSWLETNDTIGDCSFKSSMSMHQVLLYRNISSNLTTPDSVSFGLWKHCYMYALNCSCTPASLKYQPDISTILQTATTHLAVPPITTSTSLSRIIPLMLATVFSAIAFFIGLWANRRGKYIYRKILVGLLLATSILVAYAFGSTYDQYYKNIKSTCQNADNTVYCAKDAVQIEVVLFAIALGLLFIGLIAWSIASSFFKSTTAEDEDENAVEEKVVPQWNFQKNTPQRSRNKRNQSNSEQDLTAYNGYQQQGDDSAAWRDATMYDEEYDNSTNEISWEEQQNQYNDPFNNPVPIQQQQQQKHYNNSNPRYRQQQKMIREHQRRSSGYIMSEKHSSLTPPPAHQQQQQQQNAENYYNNSPISPPRGHNKTRVTSSANNYNNSRQQQRKSSANNYNQHDYNRSPPRTNRKESNDSALTLGGVYNQQRSSGKRKSSGRPLSELEPSHQPQQQQHYYNKNTPTSISPHPFQYPSVNNNSRNSFCMTPYFEEPLYSSGGSSSSNGYFQQQQQQNVPILNMPPTNTTATTEHPLNKKKIKDKRIQSYLQTPSTPTAS